MPILVTGATGRHGGNGAHLVQRLRQEGRTVRVLARTTSDRTEALAAAGAEVIFGDLRDRRVQQGRDREFSSVPAVDPRHRIVAENVANCVVVTDRVRV
jgi:uncharacterized protein YbjT (DUF2867 family)